MCDCAEGKHSVAGCTLNPCELSGVSATGRLERLRLSFHKRVWKTRSQHTGMRIACVGSGSGHTSANPAYVVCVRACAPSISAGTRNVRDRIREPVSCADL